MNNDIKRLESKVRVFEDMLLSSKRFDERLYSELQKTRIALQKKRWELERSK